MISLVSRNIKLYFRNYLQVFLSLLGALIAFFLYLIFIKEQMSDGMKMIPHHGALLDLWLMAGILAITAITTTATALTQMVYDKESSTIYDLRLTDLSYAEINISYMFSSVIIGTVMQIIMYLLMWIFFKVTDHLYIDPQILLPLLLAAVLSSLLWSAFNTVILSFVKRVQITGLINTIIGTAAGFLASVYVPMGDMPKAAQTFLKCFPASYNSTLYRRIMMTSPLRKSLHNWSSSMQIHYKNYISFNLKWNTYLNTTDIVWTLIAFTILFLMIGLIVFKWEKYKK